MRGKNARIFNILFAGLLAMIMLSIYAFFFDNTGVHIMNETGATDYKWRMSQRKSTTQEGIAWLKMDEEGFNNLEVIHDIDILLMGSSHILDVHINQEDNLSTILNSLLVGNVYNIGMSGHTLYTCVKNLRNAYDYYDPDNYVIIETDSIQLDVEKMREVISGVYPEIESHDTGILFFVQKNLPIARNFYNALENWNNSEKRGNKISGDLIKPVSKEYVSVLNQFLIKAKNDVGDTGLIILYHPTSKLDEKGNLVNTTNPEYLEIFQKGCDNNGIIFVDMTSDFEKLYEEEHVLAHGFINTAVGSGHLNKYGHRVIAERLAEIIGGETDVTE